MSITDPLVGRKLGDYTVQDLLGTGGMARVYKGYDDKLDRYAAVKVIEPNLIASSEEEEYRDRFIREARAIARLSHTRIVGIYQFGQVDNLYYIAMDYVAGKNLREILKAFAEQGKYMPVKDVLNILADIASALDYAHKNNIIHRDIKPSNVIINPEGHAILTDFGLALNAAEGTIGNTFGSVHYIAPEQAISSAQAVPQSDQYSLGIVAYEMLTGQVPFDDASAMSVALKHISDPPPPPTEINPDIPAEVEQILMKALDKDYQKRYEHAQQFVEALRTAYTMAEAPQAAPDVATESAIRPPLPATPLKGRASADALTTADPSYSQALRENMQGSQTKPPAPLSAPAPAFSAPGEVKAPSVMMQPMFVGGIVLLLAIAAGLLFLPGLLNDGGLDATATAAALEATAAQLEASSTALMLAQIATQESIDETTVALTEASTPTPRPTMTPLNSPTPTPTPRPSNTPIPTPTLTPDLVLSENDNRELLLRYDGRSLVLFNRSEADVPVANLRFILFEPQVIEETPEDDAPTAAAPVFLAGNSFTANEWGNVRSGLGSSECLQVWTLDFLSLPPDEAPADMCSLRRFFRSTARPFWISDVSEAYFEVRRGPVDVLAVCPVNVPGTFAELRCVLSVNGNE